MSGEHRNYEQRNSGQSFVGVGLTVGPGASTEDIGKAQALQARLMNIMVAHRLDPVNMGLGAAGIPDIGETVVGEVVGDSGDQSGPRRRGGQGEREPEEYEGNVGQVRDDMARGPDPDNGMSFAFRIGIHGAVSVLATLPAGFISGFMGAHDPMSSLTAAAIPGLASAAITYNRGDGVSESAATSFVAAFFGELGYNIGETLGASASALMGPG